MLTRNDWFPIQAWVFQCKDNRRNGTMAPTNQTEINSRFAAFNLFFVSFVSFFTLGYNFSILSPMIPVFRIMYNQTYTSRTGTPLPEATFLLLLTLTVSFILVGGCVGSASSKFFMTILSRKRLMQLGHFTNLLSVLVLSVVGSLTWSYEAMIIGRFLLGIPLGVYYNVVPTFVAEVSARKNQPYWQSMSAVSIAVSVAVAPFLSHPKVLGTLHLWPIATALGALPSIAFLIASYWMIETPYYLLRRGDESQAVILLERLRKSDKAGCLIELKTMKDEMKDKNVVGIKELFTIKQYRNQVIAVVGLGLNAMLTGINHILFYLDYVMKQAGVSSEASGWVTAGLMVLPAVAAISGLKLVDIFGGWRLSVIASGLIIFSHSLYTASQATLHLAPNVLPIVTAVAVAVHLFAWYGGINVALWTLLGDLTIEPTRPTALTCASAVIWIFSWFSGFIPPYLQEGLGPYSLTIWLGCGIVLLVFQVIFLPDTKGKTIDEIQAKFK